MKRRACLISLAFSLVLGFSVPGHGNDLYIGDSSIYAAGGTIDLRPNVLFIVDNSSFMSQGALGDPYDPSFDYPGDYTRNAIYRRISASGGTINYDNPNSPFISDISGVSCGEANSILTQTSYYTGPLLSNGSCRGQTGFYYTGNLLNYITNPPAGAAWQSKYYNLGEFVQVTEQATGNILYYEVIQAGNSTGSEPTWGADEITDGGIKWKRAGSVMKMVKDAIKEVAEAARDKAKFGVMVFGSNNSGGRVVAKVEKVAADDTLDDNDADGPANYTAFINAVDSISYVSANTSEPINEALWDAKLYFEDDYDVSSSRMGTDPGTVDTSTYTTPVECEGLQPNFVVVLTMGNSYTAGAKANTIGDQDQAYNVGDVDDAAKRLYFGDITVTPNVAADPVIATTVIKLINDEPGSVEDRTQSALRRAAYYGQGGYYLAQSTQGLIEALLDTMNNIVLSTNTSFVAPVVPTSPENRTYSGERVYLGFFRPNSKGPWSGNLKKYGVNNQNQIVDKNNAVAVYQSGENKGDFISTAKSYWNDQADSGLVEYGGAGEKFLADSYDIGNRNVYTYLGSSADLNDSGNLFKTTNSSNLDSHLGVSNATDRDKLIDFLRGIDTWDDDGDLNTTEKRKWILGDILHSKPLVVSYATYTFDATNEGSCSTNKTMIYVGANDGMLHAFRDCDGSEAWGFIPPDLLPSLKLLPKGLQDQYNTSGAHPYFVDGTPAVTIYDKDNDGNVGPSEAADGDADDGSDDKVIILFGLRRGGSSFYALDVTNPDDPQFMWRINSTSITRGTTVTSTSAYAELGQSWSTPELGKVKYIDMAQTKEKIVAFVGAGYDNRNEDGRFGATLGYTNADVVIPTDDALAEDSEGTVVRPRNESNDTVTNNPKGRGVYAIEVATLVSGVPNFSNGGARIWEFGYNGDTDTFNRRRMKYPIPSDITVVDTDFDGYTDRLYVGDTGGQLWRFSTHAATDPLRPYASPVINNWSGKRVFEANATGTDPASYGSGSKGRKFFYRPSITFEKDASGNKYYALFIGSGDRAHPLNTNVEDRLYGIYDRGQRTNEYIIEDDLVDVTTNLLQEENTSSSDITSLLNDLKSTSNYGWYIKLNQNSGEKVLASALAFNKVAYYTTFAPDTTPPPDNCTPGNLGTSRLYAVDYKTGEAVLNFKNNNDTEVTTNNQRALSKAGKVLRRGDRSIDLGEGIPSGLVVLMPPSGDAKLLIGCGGGVCNEDPVIGGTIIPIYWMQW